MSLLTEFPFQSDPNVTVKYMCSCGEASNISLLYFCQHCKKLDCHYCVHHSIDSYYCKKCLDTIVLSETRKQNYSCKQCFECPRCFHILNSISSQRSKSTPGPNVTEGIRPQSQNILICMNCKWTSTTLELGDKQITEFISPPGRITDKTKALIVYYKELSSMDAKLYSTIKQLSDKKLAPRHTSLFNARKLVEQKASLIGYPLDRKFGFKTTFQQKSELKLSEEFVSIATDILPSVSDSFYDEEFNLNQVTTFKHRLNDPLLQPKCVNQLRPKNLLVTTKRFKRCSDCQHILTKADIKITIKFKIHSIAYTAIPLLTINKLPLFKMNTPNNVLVSISNYGIKSISLLIESEPIPLITVKHPTCVIQLVELGDGTSYDILDADPSTPKPDYVYLICGNIAQVYFEVTPSEGCKKISFPVCLKYKYIEADSIRSSLTLPSETDVSDSEKDASEIHTLRLILNLGNISN